MRNEQCLARVKEVVAKFRGVDASSLLGNSSIGDRHVEILQEERPQKSFQNYNGVQLVV